MMTVWLTEHRSLLAVFLFYLLLLGISWRRWMSPIADSGRELDLPRRLLAGERLYQDIHYLYPPLAPYFKALLYRLFGVDLAVLQASGVVASLLIVLLVWLIGRRLLDRREAGVAAAAVVLFCVFKPTGNMISPYAYAALYGATLALGALLAALRYIEREGWRDLLLAGILTGLAGVTKQEFGLAALITCLTAVLIVSRHGKQRNLTSLRRLAVCLAPVLAIGLPVYGWFFLQVGWRTMVEDCHILYTHLPGPMLFYNARRTGLDRPLLSLLQVFGGGLVMALLAGLAILAAAPRLLRRPAVWGAFAGLTGAIILVRLVVGVEWDGRPLRSLPVILVGVILCSWRVITAGENRRDAAGEWRQPAIILTIAVYSLAVLARVALRVPSGGAFGSFFLPTSLLLLVWLFARILARRAEQSGVSGIRRVVLTGILLILAVTSIIYGVRYRRLYEVEIRTARGNFYAPSATGPVLREALDFLATRTRPCDPVVVLPEGSELAFLTDRRYPLRHQILIPGLMGQADEQRAIRTIEQLGVEHILVVNRPMREFGLTGLGDDFYQPLGEWIEDNYRVEKVIGAGGDPAVRIGDPRFFIRIYTRRGVNAP